MDRSIVILLAMILLAAPKVPNAAPLYYSEIGTTYVNYATAYSNGHKIVPVPPLIEDTLYTVYAYNDETCHFAYSYDRGQNWESQAFTATLWGNAHNPSLDVHNSLPYVVSRGDSAGIGEVFLKCPLDWSTPQRISYTPGHSTLPAIAIDDSGNMHIVWQDDTPGNQEIYYCCAQYDTSVSDIVNVSNDSGASDTYPSIGIYNGNEVHIIWERYNPNSYSPYSIPRRYLSNGNWSDEELLAGETHIPLHHPNLDYSHGEENLSATWEDSTSGQFDAYFYGGNGGGWSTPGDSRHPVVSTMDTIWSYTYWEDDSEGFDDIYAYLYHCMSGWNSYEFRDFYADEDMHHPSVANCYVVWTQGNTPPYKVMFACEGYPTYIKETKTVSGKISLSIVPNPFKHKTDIRWNLEGEASEIAGLSLRIYDALGRVVKQFDPQTTKLSGRVTWQGDDTSCKRLPRGTYFCILESDKVIQLHKIVMLK